MTPEDDKGLQEFVCTAQIYMEDTLYKVGEAIKLTAQQAEDLADFLMAAVLGMPEAAAARNERSERKPRGERKDKQPE